jgi:lipoate-protein ligase A
MSNRAFELVRVFGSRSSLAFWADRATVPRAMEAMRDAATDEANRVLEIEVGGSEGAATTYSRDQLMMLRCAATGAARIRVWRRANEGLLLGRFHRVDPRAEAPGDGGGLSRRMSGGRVVPVGPGVVCFTMSAPTVNWLDPAGAALRPDQVLNRALRPLLALLRGSGIDAFYPGRDLITAAGRTIAHASFTVMRDGVATVEMHVAETSTFSRLEALLDRFDPSGIAGVDRRGAGETTSLEEQGTPARSDSQWAELLAAGAAQALSCETRPVLAAESLHVTTADASAARDFLLVPGPLEEGSRSAAAVSMLGMVECSGRMRGDRLTGLRICGDLIAPFHTLDDVAAECEGEPLRPANIRKALARAMAGPRSFVLGLRDLDELILRLA